MELQFIIRDGKKILQFRQQGTLISVESSEYGSVETWEGRTEWQDVPLVEAENVQ